MFEIQNEPRVDVFVEGSAADNNLCIITRYKSDGSLGTSASLSVDRCGKNDRHVSWINICTDDYEGNAMLHIEALPQLIDALQKIQAQIQPTDR